MSSRSQDHLPTVLRNLAVPVIGAPMFIASGPELVLAQCKAGIVGAFPALNARPAELLDTWLTEMQADLAAYKVAHPDAIIGPIAVNQIVHQSNDRLAHDVAVCVQHRVPIIISSLQAPPKEMMDAIHGYGGVVLHDVISIRHAKKALEAGVDGLILVAAGAGGHAGTLSPFALVGEVRKFFHGPIALSGAIASGDAVLAAQAMGADFAYIGSRWLATKEANVDEAYRQALVTSTAADIVYSNLFTGVHGNYLRKSIINMGLDPDNLPQADKTTMNFGSGSANQVKAWRDIWGAGQGVGMVDAVTSVADAVQRLIVEYGAAKARMQI
ncbi:NAD(P)H-dependent flavin oxidoreductase [Herminiimonas fonticola]|uniref:Nitronate monooxygenase n=1 Tax=Herminiimonas fonticola TaxID=303380 RepID=A0A4R6GI48_9BURK|nr:nitronate monooxygenase family protein [Herminiimonas fonticola]RBA24689.1 Dioxygenases related to 2-nitropropane dioxygenase [Herminiimonas fonticola]TDN93805.1 nitronate monooxygenase [Herminiimonas fonticola]